MFYTNLPLSQSTESSSDPTNKVLGQFYDVPVQLDQNVLTAMIGMLENRGFSSYSAETISITIMIQAVRDNFNPMTILESMKKLDENDLSQIISEVLNYNRFKTSVLGSIQKVTPVDAVRRNILA
jgi:hypothetical protein